MLLQFGALGVTMSWDDDFLPLGGYLFSLGVFLRGPSRTPFRVFSNPLESLRGPPSRPLAEPSRASSNPLVALRRSSWPFVDIFFGRSSLVPQLVSKKRRSGTRRLSKTTLAGLPHGRHDAGGTGEVPWLDERTRRLWAASEARPAKCRQPTFGLRGASLEALHRMPYGPRLRAGPPGLGRATASGRDGGFSGPEGAWSLS